MGSRQPQVLGREEYQLSSFEFLLAMVSIVVQLLVLLCLHQLLPCFLYNGLNLRGYILSPHVLVCSHNQIHILA